MTEAIDFRGKTIEPGMTVAYPVRRGSQMWLKTLRVQGIEATSDGVKLSGFSEVGRRVTITNLQNCVVVN